MNGWGDLKTQATIGISVACKGRNEATAIREDKFGCHEWTRPLDPGFMEIMFPRNVKDLGNSKVRNTCVPFRIHKNVLLVCVVSSAGCVDDPG